jgi:hypothetical protein
LEFGGILNPLPLKILLQLQVQFWRYHGVCGWLLVVKKRIAYISTFGFLVVKSVLSPIASKMES